MTALDKYQRLEASGLWRPAPDEQRREVIVSVGDATLVISDLQDRPLTHWSIPAIARANPGERPACYHPHGDPSETLELLENEEEMVAAIEKLRKAIHKAKAHPGRLRSLIIGGGLICVMGAAALWLPDALRNHVVRVIPSLNQTVIGYDLLQQLERVTGRPCSEDNADAALRQMANRLNMGELVVLPNGIRTTANLPGGITAIGRTVFEDHEDPAAAAGYLLAANARAQETSGLSKLLEFGGVGASFHLVTRGAISENTLRSYAEEIVQAAPSQVPDDLMIEGFSKTRIPASPYAYAVDISGETTIALIEADSFIETGDAILTDGEWVALQEICTN